MPGSRSLLLVDESGLTRGILRQAIAQRFPEVALDAVNNPDEAMQSMSGKEYDVMVCAARLAHGALIPFLTEVCLGNSVKPKVIAVTGDTLVDLEKFPPEARDVCVRRVLYKPLSLDDLFSAIDSALNG